MSEHQPSCVSLCKDRFFIEVVMVLMQLKISASNNFSVEVHHIGLLFESKIEHITRYVESEDTSC